MVPAAFFMLKARCHTALRDAQYCEQRGSTIVPRAGYRLPGACDLLPAALRRWSQALLVVAPQLLQGRAIVGSQGLETNRAPPRKDAGTAWPERAAGLPRVRRRRSSDSSGFDFRSPTVRGRAALEEEPLPPAGGCAAHGRLALRHWCWGPIRAQEDSRLSRPAHHAPQTHFHPDHRAARVRRAAHCAVRGRRVRLPMEHAALHRMCSGRLVRGLQAGLLSRCADHVRAAAHRALRVHPLGFHCAVNPAQRLMYWAR